MKRSILKPILVLLIGVFVFSGIANAAWIWTPETKKFTNPKNAVKDTPKEQFEWAMGFYDAKDFQRAAFEFDKLAKQYEFSDYASKAQYYVGLCYENQQKYYMAYENYQKAIDNFPHLANTDEVLAREYAIGMIYLEKPSPKVMGNDIMAPLDRAVEIFKKVVENAPYGKYAEDAQFKLGEALKKSERYEEAIQAYHKISEDYPNSRYATQAMYEESYCAYRASLKPAYDSTATDNAIKTFEKFTDKNKDTQLAQKADSTMRRLKDNVAQKSFDVAKFYESQGKTEAAIIYYQDVIDNYPESSFVAESKAKIEALKNKAVKKAAAPVDTGKKKSKDITPGSQKKLSWNLFGLGGKKEEKASQSQVSEAPKKKGWRPFSFETKKEVKQQQSPAPEAPKIEPAAETPKPETPAAEVAPEVPKAEAPLEAAKPETPVVEAPKVETATEAPKVEQAPVEASKIEAVPETPKPEAQTVEAPKTEPAAQEAPVVKTEPTQTQEAPKKKGWAPFNFENKKEKNAEKPVEAKPTEKKPWLSLDLFGKKKAEETKEPVPVKEKKPWTPFSFEDKKEKKEERPVETKSAEKKSWNPLNLFGTKKAEEKKETKPVEKKPWKPFSFENKGAVEKKPWQPLYFGTNDEPMTKGAVKKKAVGETLNTTGADMPQQPVVEQGR